MSELSTNPGGASSGSGSFTERLMALGRRAEEGAGLTSGGNGGSTAPAPAAAQEESLEITERDIIFDCPRCYGELIVDKDGEQMETSCIHCGATLLVPKYMGPPSKVGKVQAQYAPGSAASSSAPMPPASGNTDYRPITQEYPTGGLSTGDFSTGATAQMIRNLGETINNGPQTGDEAPPAAEAAAPAPAANVSDRASITRSDGSLTDDVLREMRELNKQDLEMEEVRKQLEALQRHLKENNSQVTEVTGYVNQTSIKLHRFKLQLDRLKKRNGEIHKELRVLKARTIQLGGSVD